MKRASPEAVAAALAVTTLFIALPPYNLPPWALYIGWAGTFAAGGPSKLTLRKMLLTMPIGSFFAFMTAVCMKFSSTYFSGAAFMVSQCIILFSLSCSMMYLARLAPINFLPGMFFGFASFFATMFGGFGPAPGNPVIALFAVVLMNGLGPLYAWINIRLVSHERP